MDTLLNEIRACQNCSALLPHAPRPVLAASASSRIVIIGQAPGRIVHESGVPWQDRSGDRLREWMGIDSQVFYDPEKVGLLPMGFCYPGKGKTGDLQPRPECAPLWHEKVLSQIKDPQLTVLIGQYAQTYYLGNRSGRNLTTTVRNFRSYLPEFFVLPHPSPRNNIWLRKNAWFENELLPVFKEAVSKRLS